MQEKQSASDAKRIRMTTEPVEKLILKLAGPTIISMLVTSFYNLADTYFVRQLKSDSMVAAVGIVLPLMSIIQAIGFFCGQGSGNYISRAFGKRDYKDAETMAATGFYYSIGIGLIIMALGLLFSNPLAVILGAKTDATVEATKDYMMYILMGAPFLMGSIVLNNQLRMQGNAFFAMIGISAGAVANIIMDPFFIYEAGETVLGFIELPFGFGMGVAGASLATGISQALSFIILIVATSKSDNVKIRITNFSFKWYYIKGIAQGGLPSLARQGLASVSTACLNHAVGLYIVGGASIDAVQAAMTGTSKIMHFLASTVIGFGQGFQPVCGFNYGAKKYDRVIKAFYFCIKLAAVVLTVIAVVCFIFANPIAGTIAGSSDYAISTATSTFRAQLIVLPLMAWTTLCNMLLQNIGMTFKATLVAMARQGLAFIPVVLLLPFIFKSVGNDPLNGLILAQAVADVLAFAIALPIGIGVVKQMKNNSSANEE